MAKINLKSLKALRKKTGLTQEDVATALGYMTSQGYHYIENGRSNLRADQLAVLAQLYDVPIEYFFHKNITNKEIKFK